MHRILALLALTLAVLVFATVTGAAPQARPGPCFDCGYDLIGQTPDQERIECPKLVYCQQAASGMLSRLAVPLQPASAKSIMPPKQNGAREPERRDTQKPPPRPA